jgi:hypothetical protein
MSASETTKFQNVYSPLIVKENATLMVRSYPPRAFTVEDLLRLSSEVINQTRQVTADIWLLLERRLECQLSCLEVLGYSDGTAMLDAKLNECKNLLIDIGETCPFVIKRISVGHVVIVLNAKPSLPAVENFVAKLYAFQKKYDQLEFAPAMLTNDIVRSGAIVL